MIWYVQFSFCTPCNKGQFEKYSWLPFIISDHRRKLPPLSFWLSRLWGEKAVSTVSIPTLKKPSLHSTFLSPPFPPPPHPSLPSGARGQRWGVAGHWTGSCRRGWWWGSSKWWPQTTPSHTLAADSVVRWLSMPTGAVQESRAVRDKK